MVRPQDESKANVPTHKQEIKIKSVLFGKHNNRQNILQIIIKFSIWHQINSYYFNKQPNYV